MVEPINFSVKERDNQLNFDISSSELRSCTDGNFSFYLTPANNGQQRGVFRVTLNGQLVREHESEPFPQGTFQIISANRANKEVYKVKLVKLGNARIGEYFT